MWLRGKYYCVYTTDAEAYLLFCENLIKIFSPNEIIEAVINEFKDETGIDIVFSKELEKNLKPKEKEEAVQRQRRELKEKYNYLLEVHDLLKQKYQK